MLVVHVHVHVKSEYVKAFKQATIENARNSIKEPGIARFDVIQQLDEPERFILVEVYRTGEATAQHKQTAHYQKWRDAGDGNDGRAAHGRKVLQCVPGRRGLVKCRSALNSARRLK